MKKLQVCIAFYNRNLVVLTISLTKAFDRGVKSSNLLTAGTGASLILSILRLIVNAVFSSGVRYFPELECAVCVFTIVALALFGGITLLELLKLEWNRTLGRLRSTLMSRTSCFLIAPVHLGLLVPDFILESDN